jgi:hypothetical protein
VDQVTDLIDKVAAQDVNLFNKILETHAENTLAARGKFPTV